MTEVQIVIEDVLGRSPSRGDRLWVRAARTRSGSGGQVVAPVAVPIEVYDNPAVELEPGPARVRFELRDLAVDQTREFPVIIPDDGPVTLRDILDEAYDWTPAELSAFAQLRTDAEAAAEAARLDRLQTGLDRVATSEDRTQTGLDRVATGQDRVATGQDRTATGEDRTQTGLDREQTGQDRQATGEDRQAAASSASDAAGSEAAAAGHASAAGADADRAQQYADSFGLSATTTTGAPGTPAQVTVTGDGPAYEIGFTVPQGEQGDPGPPGEVSQAMLDAAVATLVDNAPEALNTLSELAAALGNDPNFATTTATAIGERAKTADVNAALAGKADAGHTHTKAQVGLGNVDNTSDAAKPVSTATQAALVTKSDVGHKHPVSDIEATGVPASYTYLRGDGSWTAPPNTTYAVPGQTEAEAGVATTGRAFSAQRVAQGAIAASGKKDWQGTQAQYDALPTKDADRTYWIV